MGFVSVFGTADPEGGARFRERRPPQLCQVIFGLPAERIGYLAGLRDNWNYAKAWR